MDVRCIECCNMAAPSVIGSGPQPVIDTAYPITMGGGGGGSTDDDDDDDDDIDDIEEEDVDEMVVLSLPLWENDCKSRNKQKPILIPIIVSIVHTERIICFIMIPILLKY